MKTLTTVNQVDNRRVLTYELVGMVFIIMFGSMLHFTFELSGSQSIVGMFSAVNESVWEHLKLAFWPTMLYMFLEYRFLKKSINNFLFAKTLGVCLMIIAIPIIFYSYTAVTGTSIFAIDISTFIVAVIIGQLLSYKMLNYRELPENLNKASIIVLILLALTFVLFTFYPPRLIIFEDPNTGNYGIL